MGCRAIIGTRRTRQAGLLVQPAPSLQLPRQHDQMEQF